MTASDDDFAEPIAVLGGGGFLGARLVRHALAETTGPVASLSREPGAHPAVVDSRLVRVPVDALDTDALQAGALEEALARLAPGRIILCTALGRMADCEAYPVLARSLNVDLPRRVARFAREHGARLVHVSTDLVFGATPPPAPAGFREQDPPNPTSTYGESKAAGEAAVLEEDRTALVCRLPLLFGDSEGRGLGASDALRAALARGERPALFTDEWRTPLDVDDAAAALLELSGREESGLLNVAGPERLTRHDLGRAVMHADGAGADGSAAALARVTRAELGMDASRPGDVSLDASRARGLLRTRLRTPAEALAARA